MTGERSYTTKIWRPPSLIGFSSADALSTSMDPPGEPVISTWKRPCQKIQNGSEFPELVAQNSRNPQLLPVTGLESAGFDRCAISSFASRPGKKSCSPQSLAGFVFASSLLDQRIGFVDPQIQVIELQL